MISLGVALYFGYQTLQPFDSSAGQAQADVKTPQTQNWLQDRVIDPEYIKQYNARNEVKLAGNSQFQNWKLEDAKKILNSNWSSNYNNLDPCPSLFNPKKAEIGKDLIPHQEQCTAPIPVVSQGKCGSSYAIAVADMYSARYCSRYILKRQGYVQYSAQDLISCHSRDKCKEGTIDEIWNRIETDGIVTDECFPYSSWEGTAADCKKKCTTTTVEQFADPVCFVMTEEGIKQEIKQNGPVVMIIPVYSDFLVY